MENDSYFFVSISIPVSFSKRVICFWLILFFLFFSINTTWGVCRSTPPFPKQKKPRFPRSDFFIFRHANNFLLLYLFLNVPTHLRQFPLPFCRKLHLSGRFYKNIFRFVVFFQLVFLAYHIKLLHNLPYMSAYLPR